ncbi:MAG: polyribonucleotide nucleotidyltransferase [Candidatus Cloacimonetes bacterium]|nr:polyribonucleotide nucleotidyltransferase [Candidatus Cloacimonadota bacterium]MCF7815080.1 polyribonucleotide nucleotidyltransferase [Candidatus Cloacimonadota bacterium]MCF7868561.1 polyribonucleotide nucleotidyltransferase [Candidatus Cloacimonadota bacterium]MCF7884273.1 polyribonucleotide nucleotidyltransferase [Candidatus Cloacimonadota bacterium]
MHKFDIKKKSIEIAGKNLTIETGRMAKQANGAVFMTYGGTSVLVTATAAKEPREGTDFFPLTVDFIEKYYASGKIPGGFFKREARPSTTATLNARLIDRPIRPLFPKGFRNAVHVVVTVLSFDGENDPGVLGILGASLALSISDIPFNGPCASVKVGLVDDEIVINPTSELLENSKLELDVAGTKTAVVMIEAGAKEVSEERMMEAIYAGHEIIKDLVVLQEEFIKDAGKEKMEFPLDLVPEEILKNVEKDFGKAIKDAANVSGKLERYEAVDKIKAEILEKYKDEIGEEFEEQERYYQNAFEELFAKFVREAILKNNHRVDGRGMDDIRDITCEIDVLPIVHGSALFTRGETQSLGTVTLGTGRDEQIVDGLADEFKKNFFLHYNFPPFSVGEASFMRGPGRRELGHGALAERAILPMIPSKDDFPYTLRLVSEILESNGSSSMASVCSATLALMAAGVPIQKPVAGIANGLIMDGEDFVVLTDIMGLEDHLGDMDFKVTGTKDGITAMQMDIKIEGITKEIMGIALEKAKVARFYILDKITEVIPEPRKELADTAPRIESFKIDPDKIGAVIGSGGKMIKQIIETTGAEINIDDDGTISISSADKKSIDHATKIVQDIVEEPEMNGIYEGTVSRIETYGAFVKFMSESKEGLVHISQLHTGRIAQVEDMLKLGDTVKVKFIGLDRGKYKLSMKGVEGNPEPKKVSEYISKPSSERNSSSRDRHHNPRNRDNRNRDNRDRDNRDRGNKKRY